MRVEMAASRGQMPAIVYYVIINQLVKSWTLFTLFWLFLKNF